MKITLENILNRAKTEEQKMNALAKIQKEIKKNRLIVLIYGLVYFGNPFFLMTAFFTLLFVQGELVFFERLPDIIIKILDTYNGWIMSISEWAVFKKLNEWIMSVKILPTWVIYLAVVAIVIVAVPSIVISIAKALIAVFTDRDGSRPLNGTLPECCKKTYKLVKRYEACSEFVLAYTLNIIIIIIFLLLLICALALDGFFSVDKPVNLFSNILGLVVGGALFAMVLWVVLMLPAIVTSNIAARGKMTVDNSDLEKFERFWAEVDPEKKAELEKQREEDLRRWQEEQKRKEEHLERLAEELHNETSGKISNEEWWEVVDSVERMKRMKQEHGENYYSDL